MKPPPIHPVQRLWRVFSLLLMALAFASCSPGGESSAASARDSVAGPPPPRDTLPPVLVLAASDLQEALPRIVELFEARTGARVDVSFGSTGNLTAQIENGAPADLFLAADETFVDRLEKGGYVRAGARRVYAQGMLAITWRDGVPPADSIQSLTDPVYRTIAIANPESAPYGAIARQALRMSGVLDVVKSRLVFGENVAQTLQLVESGNADAAIVSIANVFGRSTRFRELRWTTNVGDLPGGGFELLYTPLQQTAAILANAPRPETAKQLLDFMLSSDGWPVMRGYGFQRPENLTMNANGQLVPGSVQP